MAPGFSKPLIVVLAFCVPVVPARCLIVDFLSLGEACEAVWSTFMTSWTETVTREFVGTLPHDVLSLGIVRRFIRSSIVMR